MPKERRTRIGAHAQSVRLDKRKFAAQANAVEHIDVGGSELLSGNDLLQSMGTEDQQPVLKKKEKQQLKREAFVQRLESTRSPYAKTHAGRRLKRKAKEQIAGGLADMQSALLAVEKGDADEEGDDDAAQDTKPPPKPVPGQIGEGKSEPLSKAQRKRALQMERLRHPLILANPEFASNPFQTIRTHAQNTLLKHD
ncbi:hypothetical protein PLICRDRAFT_35748 [Plicaturopsis crispa FD-325 SS-3]|nr:hypothetical protein PLICRDRAFT_35748 [Plicaturopsis crispa FD-325 SS-3]